MNRVIQVLNSEHRLIGWATECLDYVAKEAQENGDLLVVTAIKLLEFFEHFVDGAHQEKEERCVFPVLLACGLDRDQVQSLVEDHAKERASLQTMRGNLEGAAYNDAWSRDVFVSSAGRYASSLREHAALEERVLMPLVARHVGPGMEHKILAGFRATNAELLPRPRQHYLSLVYEAAARIESSHSQQIFPWFGRHCPPSFRVTRVP